MRIEFHAQVLQQLRKLPCDVLGVALMLITMLRTEPRAPGAKKLVGSHDWRIRTGPYRIGYEVDDKDQIMTVLTVAKRSDAYR
ncbi:type II toxin-antitoxin system RelE family toxin [Nocardia sp. CA-129566]|uniref:type II toxin-antitoxin system RelE family toxin n=1 Tax=Nocardia sp. CA-129566 TaxID=3239976 RepID=UPI003D989510